MKSARNLLVMACVLCLAATHRFTFAAGPSIAEIAAGAKQTIDKLAKTPASWETFITRPQGTVHVITLRTPSMQKIGISVGAAGGPEQPLAQIIERDGFWYVIEGTSRTKHRAYETPFQAAVVPMFMKMAHLRFATATDPAAYGTFESAEGTLATFRAPLPAPIRTQAMNTLAEATRLTNGNLAMLKPEVRASLEALKDILDHGIPTRIEVEKGLIFEAGSTQLTVATANFRWLDPAPAKEFDVSGNWDDNTADPTLGDLNSLAMISHAGTWRSGQPSPDTEAQLVDVNTGKIRRIPLRDGLCGIGCFNSDRLSVIVTGVDPSSSLFGLYQVNLKTGENKRLGGAALTSGITMTPVLSPDGKRVAVLHKQGNESTLQWRVYIVDLASDTSSPISNPMDIAYLNWAPDGQSLILLRREENADPKKVADSTISRMDLQGKLQPIHRGRDPLVLADGRIMFQDSDDSLWKTCTLAGSDIKLLANGLKDYFFPTAGPDGKRLIVMHKTTAGPAPEIIDIATGKAQPIPVPGGLWAMPSWR